MKEKDLIDRILGDIYPEKTDSEQIGENAFDWTDEFLDEYEKEDIAEVIYIASLDEKNIVKISMLFDVLIWSTRDNGAELMKTVRKWVKENNKRKIEIALNMSGVYPISDAGERRTEMKRIMELFPDLKKRCEYWLKD